MKKLFWIIFGMILKGIFAFVLIYFCYALCFEKEKDVQKIIKLGVVIAIYVGFIIRDIKEARIYSRVMKACEKQYRGIIRGTFSEDERSNKEFLQAIIHYQAGDLQSAHKVLDKLLEKCKNNRDYVAVYLLHGLSFVKERNMDEAITAYKTLLQYNGTNSVVWCDLGLCYMEKGMMEEAKQAYDNALMYNPINTQAYINSGTCCLQLGEPGPALDYALKALGIDATLHKAMSVAAMAYHMLGDSENVEKYCKMYGANGGNAQSLREHLKCM